MNAVTGESLVHALLRCPRPCTALGTARDVGQSYLAVGGIIEYNFRKNSAKDSMQQTQDNREIFGSLVLCLGLGTFLPTPAQLCDYSSILSLVNHVPAVRSMAKLFSCITFPSNTSDKK